MAWFAPGFLFDLIGRCPTLPHTHACSTIGAERLNYRVRDGNGWDPLARVTQNWDPLNILTGSFSTLQCPLVNAHYFNAAR